MSTDMPEKRLEEVANVPIKYNYFKPVRKGALKALGLIVLGGLVYLASSPLLNSLDYMNKNRELSKANTKLNLTLKEKDIKYDILLGKNQKLNEELKSMDQYCNLEELMKFYNPNSLYKVRYRTKNGLILMTAAVDMGKKVEQEYNLLYSDSRNRIRKLFCRLMPEKWADYNNDYRNGKLDICISSNTMRLGNWEGNTFRAKGKIELKASEMNAIIGYLKN
jgi:hypothetical protein